MAPFVNLFGPVDAILAPYAEYFVLGLVLVNMITRHLAHRRHVAAAGDGEESVSRYLPHVAANVLLVLGSFYYLTLHHHSGTVLSVIVLVTVIADVFEFEGRAVELRQDWSLDAPKGAIAGSLLALAYAAYLSLFYLVKPYWELIV